MILAICIVGMFAPMALSTFHGALVVESPALEVVNKAGQRKDISFQLNGVIFGAADRHEYGHFLQQQDRGAAYYASVAVPSVVANMLRASIYIVSGEKDAFDYYAMPWERDADELAHGSALW
ncbi:MAG: hypothetical protein GY783_09855 [Gammaproteobacteria bacterium]|nr:hypothetical protein [Gammaproteobacteria bacterium]